MITRRSGTASMRITVSEVWNGTPLRTIGSGTIGRPPAATTIRSAVISSVPEPSVRSTDSACAAVNRGVALVDGDVRAASTRYSRPPAEIGSMRPNTRSRMSVQRTLSTPASTPSRAAPRTLSATSAGSTNIFVGMQPTFRQVPPKTPCSTIATSRSANRSSTIELPEPVPMMTRSWWRTVRG